MYFDFEDRYDDYTPVGGTIRRWDGVLVSMQNGINPPWSAR